MQFNSITFYLFLIGTLFFTSISPKEKKWIPLLTASYIFYGSWRIDFLLLIIFSTIIDYLCALWMESSNTKNAHIRRLLLLTSISSNLGLLATFKYGDFFIVNLNLVLRDYITPIPQLNWILPVGISFYTFQTLSYSIDVYHKKISPERHLGQFALFVVFFPQLIAGPIERASRLLPQLQSKIKINHKTISDGFPIFTWGLLKKTVIADRLAPYVDTIYSNPSQFTSSANLLATIFFSIQILADFSAYCDMARGCSKMLNINLMENFNSPYFASSFKDFWSRWHISLSTWFKDYLYIQLGGNRKGPIRTSCHLWVVFIASGLWHGASWNFVLWGILHGSCLSLQMLIQNYSGFKFTSTPYTRFISGILTFSAVTLFWIPFRCQDLTQTKEVLSAIFHFHNPSIHQILVNISKFDFFILMIFIPTMMIVDRQRHFFKTHLLQNLLLFRVLFLYLALATCYFLAMPSSPNFIYFQF
jgi:D-alanyl-lipoteichoic acid acyltransferase DltB (MBOAT superfamily)